MCFIKCPNLQWLKQIFHSTCLLNTNTCKPTNFLELNSKKTEPVVVAPEAQLQKVAGCWLILSHLSIKVCSLGISHNPSLNLQSHINCNSPPFSSKTTPNSNCNRILSRLISRTGTSMSSALQIRVLRCTNSWEKITLTLINIHFFRNPPAHLQGPLFSWSLVLLWHPDSKKKKKLIPKSLTPARLACFSSRKCSALGLRPKKVGQSQCSKLPSSGCLTSAPGDSVQAVIVQIHFSPLLPILFFCHGQSLLWSL